MNPGSPTVIQDPLIHVEVQGPNTGQDPLVHVNPGSPTVYPGGVLVVDPRPDEPVIQVFVPRPSPVQSELQLTPRSQTISECEPVVSHKGARFSVVVDAAAKFNSANDYKGFAVFTGLSLKASVDLMGFASIDASIDIFGSDDSAGVCERECVCVCVCVCVCMHVCM